MSVVKSFVGTWKIDPNASENLPAYLQAIGLAGDMVEGAVKQVVEMKWVVDGNQVTHKMRARGNSHVTTFTLGNEFTETLMGGRVYKTTYTEEGGKLVRRQIGSPYNCTATFQLVNGQLVETRTCESSPPVSCVRKLNRT
ncbi:fatty acid-binding protein 1-like [Watersipora subatra]|uniref:fatty acid-binding protein 1-like n=1 Tax=Watersipora subatra TaxID=2589382 RepID=UPI00355C340B